MDCRINDDNSCTHRRCNAVTGTNDGLGHDIVDIGIAVALSKASAARHAATVKRKPADQFRVLLVSVVYVRRRSVEPLARLLRLVFDMTERPEEFQDFTVATQWERCGLICGVF